MFSRPRPCTQWRCTDPKMSHNKIGYTGTSASTAVAAPAAPYGVYSIFRCLANLKPNSNAKLKSNPKPNLNLNLRFPRFGETAKMKHSALAVVRRSQKFRPAADPFPGVQDGQNLIAGDGHYLYLQTQFGEDRCTQFRVIVVTDPQTHKHTHTNKQTHRQD